MMGLLRRILPGFLATCLLFLLLFLANGRFFAAGTSPYGRTTRHAPRRFDHGRRTVKIMAWNLAKGFAITNEGRFDSVAAVNERLERFAQVIRAEEPDFVFLSEVMVAAGPVHYDQVQLLVEGARMHAWAFGENYNFGIPGFRAVGGNAILSRYPIEPLVNPNLAGRRPFYRTRNNRRVLWCTTRFAGEEFLLASVHNDSFDLDNNLVQTQQILDFAGDRPAILAGDFNAEPETASIALILANDNLTGDVEAGPTFPADAPTRRLDYIFVPSRWELLEFRILEDTVSDHRPVVAVYRIP